MYASTPCNMGTNRCLQVVHRLLQRWRLSNVSSLESIPLVPHYDGTCKHFRIAFFFVLQSVALGVRASRSTAPPDSPRYIPLQ